MPYSFSPLDTTTIAMHIRGSRGWYHKVSATKAFLNIPRLLPDCHGAQLGAMALQEHPAMQLWHLTDGWYGRIQRPSLSGPCRFACLCLEGWNCEVQLAMIALGINDNPLCTDCTTGGRTCLVSGGRVAFVRVQRCCGPLPPALNQATSSRAR